MFNLKGQPVFKFDMGAEVEDMITGLKGVVVNRTQYLEGSLGY